MEDPTGGRPTPNLRKLPLLAPTELDICASFCTPYSPSAPHDPPARLTTSDFSLQRSFRQEDLHNELEDCSLSPAPIAGSYLPNSAYSLLHPSAALPPALNPTDRLTPAGLYTFIPSSCTFSHPGRRFQDHASCITKPFKALFYGDSHTRAMYDILKWRMEGNDTITLVSPKLLGTGGGASVGGLDLVRLALRRIAGYEYMS
jgi:hypothetical protein